MRKALLFLVVGLLAVPSLADTLAYNTEFENLADGDTFYAEIHLHEPLDSIQSLVNGRLGNDNMSDDAKFTQRKIDSVSAHASDWINNYTKRIFVWSDHVLQFRNSRGIDMFLNDTTANSEPFRIYSDSTTLVAQFNTDSVQFAGGLSVDTIWDVEYLPGPFATTQIKADTVRAVDGGGLHLQDDGGNGLFVKDGGSVGVGTTSPAGDFHVKNSNSYRPSVYFENTTDDANGVTVRFLKDRADAGNGTSTDDDDALGYFYFQGFDSEGIQTSFASMIGTCLDETHLTEDGKLEFKVLSGGTDLAVLTLDGESATPAEFARTVKANRFMADTMRAVDGDGLHLQDDGGNGIHVADAGVVYVNANLGLWQNYIWGNNDLDSDAGVLNLNYYGYAAAGTRYRDLAVYDGKSTGSESVMFVDGSAHGVAFGNHSAPDEMIHMKDDASGKPVLKIENTNTNEVGGAIHFYKITTDEADGDRLGYFEFVGNDSNHTPINYANIEVESPDVTSGATSGKYILNVRVNNSGRELFTVNGYNGSVGQAEIILNEESVDCDMRWESDNADSALFIQGSDGTVYMEKSLTVGDDIQGDSLYLLEGLLCEGLNAVAADGEKANRFVATIKNLEETPGESHGLQIHATTGDASDVALEIKTYDEIATLLTLNGQGTMTVLKDVSVGDSLGVADDLVVGDSVSVGGSVVVTGDIYTTDWTDYAGSSTIVGWDGPTALIYYKVVGDLVHVIFSVTGTSDATTTSFTLPHNHLTGLPSAQGPMYFADNSTVSATFGYFSMAAGGATVNFYKAPNAAANTWTNSNTKTISGQFFYVKE